MKHRKQRLQARQQKWLQEVDRYLRDNLDNHNVVVADIAFAMCMSERNFYRKLKKLTGITPNQYIQAFRLNSAFELLNSGQVDTVKELAGRVGFYHTDYFSRLFEACYGRRPVEWIHENTEMA
ncbi:MAG: helix-turn-helix transcriptional regulator [Phaeodactylibacter sp.]|nr:helix-turn-helix transcriptional regulator [Phaeodactylibacter sp.]MCB9300692.1 helix-turn-helix transcriptional regulator [Lewinellaceae bacterium]